MSSLTLLLGSMALFSAASSLTNSDKTKLTSPGKLSITTSSETGYYDITTNGIPNHETGEFPASYNPNSITSQNYNYKVPSSPSKASTSSCLPMGPIGFAKSGIPVYNPLTANGDNAVEGPEAEQFDQCDGHPDMNGRYHYHSAPMCIGATDLNDVVVGVALDGYPIYSMRDADGKQLTASDLDDCHGRTVDGQYRYHLTADYPYIMGCFSGELHSSVSSTLGRQGCSKAISDQAGDGGSDGTDSGSGSESRAPGSMAALASLIMVIVASVVLT